MPLFSGFRCLVLASAALVSGSHVSAAANDSVFAGFAGAWSGPGTIVLANGEQQQINCNSTYVIAAGGLRLDQALNCSSPAASLQLTASYNYAAGALSGRWNEATRGMGGALTGQARAGLIRATVAGIGFVGGLGMTAHGKSQSVTFQSQGGGDIRKVSISLRKG